MFISPKYWYGKNVHFVCIILYDAKFTIDQMVGSKSAKTFCKAFLYAIRACITLITLVLLLTHSCFGNYVGNFFWSIDQTCICIWSTHLQNAHWPKKIWSIVFLSTRKVVHSVKVDRKSILSTQNLVNPVPMKEMFYIKVCRWLDLNHRPMVLEAPTLPTEPQPLPILFVYFRSFHIVQIVTDQAQDFFDTRDCLNALGDS